MGGAGGWGERRVRAGLGVLLDVTADLTTHHDGQKESFLFDVGRDSLCILEIPHIT